MWIKMHSSILSNRKLSKMAYLLNIHKAQALGHLSYFWLAVAANSPNGDITDWESYEISEFALWDGDPEVFAKVLRETKLISEKKGKVFVNDWDEHNDFYEYVSKKKKDRERKRKTTSTQNHGEKSGGNSAGIPRKFHGNSTEVPRKFQGIPGLEEEVEVEEEKKEKKNKKTSDAERVLDHFRKFAPRTRGGKTLLSPLNARIRDGFTVNDLCQAIELAQADRWMVETGKCYDFKYLMRENVINQLLNSKPKKPEARGVAAPVDTTLPPPIKVPTGEEADEIRRITEEFRRSVNNGQ